MHLNIGQTLKSRFIISFLLFIILPVFTINFLISLQYYNSLLKVQLEKVRFSSLEIAANVEEEAERIALKTSVLAYDQELLNLFIRYNSLKESSDKLTVSRDIVSRMDTYFDYSSRIITALIFFENNTFFTYKSPPANSPSVLTGAPWFQEVRSNPEQVYFIDDLSYQTS